MVCGSWRQQPGSEALICPRASDHAMGMFELHYRSLMVQIAEALTYLHGEGYSHNDLHEGNVLVRFNVQGGAHVKAEVGICDWGRATHAESLIRLSLEGRGGRSRYLPPEHFLCKDWKTLGQKGAVCAPTTDVFSFGYLLKLVIRKRKHPPPKQWLEIARNCQDLAKYKRPSMRTVLAQLQACL